MKRRRMSWPDRVRSFIGYCLSEPLYRLFSLVPHLEFGLSTHTVSNLTYVHGALAGRRAVHLSDLHLDRYQPRHDRVVETLNELRPDWIFITGDLLNVPEGLPHLFRFLTRLREIAPVYITLGNHDHYSGVSVTQYAELADRHGIEPRGETPCFALALAERRAGIARAGIVKDAGDDPDVTRSGLPVTNLVVMGMGEPLLNYEALLKACYLLSDEEGPNLAQRHIVISTSGFIPKIRRFTAEGHKFRLAISLNATTDDVRTRLMPLNRKYPIAALLAAARDYALAARERVTFEYVLLAGVNDTLDDAARLKDWVRDIPCKINLIPFNAVDENFRRPSYQHIEAFYQRLQDLRAPVTLRWSKGDDIDAACGQLWTKVEKSLSPVPAV